MTEAFIKESPELRILDVIGLSLVGSIGFSTVLFLPRFIGAMVDGWSVSEKTAGLVASVNIAGIATAGFLAFVWVSNANMARMLVAAMIVLAIANALPTLSHEPSVLFLIRFLDGLAVGSITAGVAATFAQSSNPDRNIGIFVACQLLFGAIGNLSLPIVIEKWGIEGGYFLIALLAVLAILLIVRFPWRRDDLVPQNPAALDNAKFSICVLMGVGAVAAFFMAINTVWVYLERLGVAAGHSAQFIGLSLSIGQICGLAGAVVVPLIVSKFRRIKVLAVGLLLMAASFLGLAQSEYWPVFLVCVAGIVFFWSFLLPAMLGSLAAADPTGRIVALTNGVAAVGLTLGPMLGGWLRNGNGYNANLIAAALLLALSLILLVPLTRQQSQG